MPEETVTTTTTVEATEAERAKLAADEAAAAAARAGDAAAVQVQNATQQAADRVAAIEGEAASWRGLKEQFEVQTAESRSLMGTLQQQLAALGDKLTQLTAPPPPPPPEPPTNLNPPPGSPGAGPTPAPEPESPAPKRRAHRWI